MAPTFQFEENRLVYSLRLLAYPGDDFTSEQSCRCAFAVTAARKGDRTPPAHETNLSEWSRVLDALLAAEPKTWVEDRWAKRAEEAARIVNER
jgi:hypothetical protein